jgi:hypothetical protein
VNAFVRRARAIEDRVGAGFWRAAAGVTGFAVHHPRTMRVLPIALVAVAAFALGRGAGSVLFTIP